MTVLTRTRPQARRLTVADRGDCCGAQAFVIATKPGRSELLFCVHHYDKDKNDALLLANGWDVTDFRNLMSTKPTG